MAKRIELPLFIQNKLLETVESGVGYHKIDILLKDGRVLNDRTVLNCQFLQLEKNEIINPDDISKLIPI